MENRNKIVSTKSGGEIDQWIGGVMLNYLINMNLMQYDFEKVFNRIC
jgi:hypothetical protein